MNSFQLTSNPLNVSRLCLGTMTFGHQVEQAAANEMVALSLDSGINFFDTANAYQLGASESMLGKALAGHRKQCIIATKVWGRMGNGPDDRGLSRTAILKAIDASLRRLGTDYVDIYYLHQPDYSVHIQESLETLNDLVHAGKIRYPASSNYSAWQVAEMLAIAERNSWAPPRITQTMYNLLARGAEQEFLPMAEHFNVSTVTYNPLAGGLLTGKHSLEKALAGSRFDGNIMYQDRYWHKEDFEAVEILKQATHETGRSLVSLAFGWLLHHTSIQSVVLGASRLSQLAENLKSCAEGRLSNEELAACEQIWRKLRGPVPAYNR